MGLKEVIKKYLGALEKSDYENLISMFASNAISCRTKRGGQLAFANSCLAVYY